MSKIKVSVTDLSWYVDSDFIIVIDRESGHLIRYQIWFKMQNLASMNAKEDVFIISNVSI